MATIIEHGKYWREDIQRVDPNILIRCPECSNEFVVSLYDCFERELPAQCICGCKFIPDESEVVKV